MICWRIYLASFVSESSPYKLLIPADKVVDFSKNLANVPEEQRVSWTRHKVSVGDDLVLIAHKYHTTVNLIKELNRLKTNSVKKGQFVIIPNSKNTVEATKNNLGWYLSTTKDKLKLIKKIIDKLNKSKKKMISDKIAYTLILRIRTLDIIKKLIEKKSYSNKDFIELINNISGGKNAYERYLAVKNDLEDENGISIGEIEKLHAYLKNQLVKINGELES